MYIIKKILKKLHIYSYITQLYDNIVFCFSFLKLIFKLIKLKNKELFFFFPVYQTGGAEKIHSYIVQACTQNHPVVFFTQPSTNDNYKKTFFESANCFDIYPFLRTENVYRVLLLRLIINKINANPNAKVFSCNVRLFYDIIHKFKSNVICTDLIHAFVSAGEIGAEHWSLPVAQKLKSRITISEKTKNDLIQQYKNAGLAEELNTRIMVRNNFSFVPNVVPKKNNEQIKIVFVGRNSTEKRISLVAEVAYQCSKFGLQPFVMIGAFLENSIPEKYHFACRFMGGIENENTLNKSYSEADILILLSEREGIPLVVQEAMSHGVVPICTCVGGIGEIVEENSTGKLIQETKSENIVAEATRIILALYENRDELNRMSENVYNYAKTHFSKKDFDYFYQKLLCQ